MENFTLRVVLDGHLEGSGGAAEDPGAALSLLHSFENILNENIVNHPCIFLFYKCIRFL